MIGSLRGTLIDRSGSAATIEVGGGVGYLVTMSPPTLSQLGPFGTDVFVHVYTHVREDAIVLFGFLTREERRLFETLLSAHGVGPALALAILSSLSPESLRSAVATDDVDALTMVPGVGKKTAARLLIELKSKLAVSGDDYSAAIAAAGDGSPAVRQPIDARNDVRAALTELGYGSDEIRNAVRQLPAEGDASALLKEALAHLSGSRR
jgi:holliday junction DNA helicase RuvA